MKKILCLIFACFLAFGFCSVSLAAEHGGKEHGGKEHGGATVAEPTADDIHNAMAAYITEKTGAAGSFEIMDQKTGKTRKLLLDHIHDRVGKTGSYYYSCADFKDTETGEMLDLDLDVESKDGVLTVVDVRIHKVDGKERYTYDDKDNRIPVTE